MDNNRNSGLDLLKIYATLLVLVLHIGGFAMEFHGKQNYTLSTLNVYFVLEAMAYPAIHLFVMIGSWFMVDYSNPIKHISKIWMQTWVVSIIGIVVYVVVIKEIPDFMWGGGIMYISFYRSGVLVCDGIYYPYSVVSLS